MNQNSVEARNQLALIDSLKKSEHYKAFLKPLLNRLSSDSLDKMLEPSISAEERDKRYHRHVVYREISEIVDKQEACLKSFILKEP